MDLLALGHEIAKESPDESEVCMRESARARAYESEVCVCVCVRQRER